MTASRTLFDEDALIRLNRVQSLAASPDGSFVAVAVDELDDETRKYVSQIWRVNLADGTSRRLTQSSFQDSAPAFRHDGSLAYSSARPEDAATPDDEAKKRAQVWALPETGEARPLTDEPLGVSGFACAQAADIIVTKSIVLESVAPEDMRETAQERAKKGPSAILYTETPVRFWDHWVPEAVQHLVVHRNGERVDLTPEAGHRYRHAEIELSADGSKLAVTNRVDAPASDGLRDGQLEVWDTASGTITAVFHEERSSYGAPLFAPNGKRLVASRYPRGDGLGDRELVLIDLETKECVRLAGDLDAWLVPQCWTPDGSAVLAVGELGGHVPVFRIDASSGAVSRITSPDAGGTHHNVLALGDGERAVGIRSSLLHPPEPFLVAVATDATPEIVAQISGFEPAEFATVENRVCTSTDDADVQYWVVRPTDSSDAGGETRRPVLYWIHGGPISAWGDGWHWRWNPLVGLEKGMTMVLPNPRGSTGFGFDYVAGIWGNTWGGQCYEDLVSVFDDVEKRDDIDPAKTVAMGGSFGGYMANWLGTQTDRFACLISHAGIASMNAFHGVTDGSAWFAHMLGSAAFQEGDPLARYSPIQHVEGWKTPTLVIHGDLDYRVPIGEALILFEALQRMGVDSELLVYPDENHWIAKPNNILSWYGEVFRFMAKHLGT